MNVTIHRRDPPPLEELAGLIEKCLQSNFASATATIVQCPDLSQAPFNLAAPGLSGNPSIADIGGQPNLFPVPNFDAKYSLLSLAQDMQMSPSQGFLLGAGAAPFHDIDHNAELAPNLSWKAKAQSARLDIPETLEISNKTHVIEVNESGSSVCRHAESTNCALMANLYGSKGEPGPVLKITARARTGEMSFTNCIRLGLRDVYGDERPVSLGGVFLLKSGKAKFHIMPDFPSADRLPFRDRKQVETEWLTYHDFEAPIVCLSVMHSADPENLGLRMEHTHCFATDGGCKGGHYYYDVLNSSEEVEYEAYLNPALVLYRIDRPGA